MALLVVLAAKSEAIVVSEVSSHAADIGGASLSLLPHIPRRCSGAISLQSLYCTSTPLPSIPLSVRICTTYHVSVLIGVFLVLTSVLYIRSEFLCAASNVLFRGVHILLLQRACYVALRTVGLLRQLVQNLRRHFSLLIRQVP